MNNNRGNMLDWLLIGLSFYLICNISFVREFWFSTPNNFIYHYQTIIAAAFAVLAAFMGGKYIKDGILFENKLKKQENLRSVLYYLNQMQAMVKGYYNAFNEEELSPSQIQRKLGYAINGLEWGLTEINTCINVHDHYEIRHNLNLPHTLLEEIRQMYHEDDSDVETLIRKFKFLNTRFETVEKILRNMMD